MEVSFDQDGNFYTVHQSDPTGGTVYLSKYNGKTAELEWQKKVNDSGTYALIGNSNFIFTKNGGFAIAGYRVMNGDDQNMYAMAFDRNGNKLWSREYGKPGLCLWGREIMETPSGGFIVTASTSGAKNNYYMVQLDASGNELCSTWYPAMSGNTCSAGSYIVGYGCRGTEDVCVKYVTSICE